MTKIKQLTDVVDWRLCIGCGACAYACPDKAVTLYNFPREGIRPVVAPDSCASCDSKDCLRICPAVESDYRFSPPLAPTTTAAETRPHATSAFEKDWGPVLEIWEGYASDPDIRFKGSSGGALTAISAFCLEKGGMHGVLHIAEDEAKPLENATRLSRTRAQLVAATGSRYSPASVCDRLDLVENAPAPCVIIGKPAEIAAVRNGQRLRPGLDAKVGLTLSFFCAESPSTSGTTALLEKNGVDPQSVQTLRYRGYGWPGHFAPIPRGKQEPAFQMTYRESWAFLQAFRPWAAQMWPDGAGELADISCGDPWYEEPDGKNPGTSLVVVRTERGRRILRAAMDAGYVTLTRAEDWKLARSQPGLLRKKGAIWGRRQAMRILRLPTTRFPGLALWHCWKPLSFDEKLRSTFGTLRRAISRRLYRPLKLTSDALRTAPSRHSTTASRSP